MYCVRGLLDITKLLDTILMTRPMCFFSARVLKLRAHLIQRVTTALISVILSSITLSRSHISTI